MIQPLYRKELRHTYKVLIGFMLLLSMYHVIIISMFDPQKAKTLEALMSTMGNLMKAFGMKTGAKGLLGFISTYLYGFIMLLFPSIFTMILGNMLMGSYLRTGSMVYLLSTPHKRTTIAVNQIVFFFLQVMVLIGYTSILTLLLSRSMFPGQLDTKGFTYVCIGLMGLHLFIAAFTFLINVIFGDRGSSLGIVLGFILMEYLFQMGANMGSSMEFLKYLTIFSLFDPALLSKGDASALLLTVFLYIGAAVMAVVSVRIFRNKDLSI